MEKSYFKKGFTRSAGLTLVLTSALSMFYGVYLMDETGILDQAYQVDHKSDTNSLEQGINAYIIDKKGELPGAVNKLQSGTYEVCKQGMLKCPEGSISLDELVAEGYLKEIPSSYLAENEQLTGYKLTYNAEKYLINIQNEDDDLQVFNGVKSRGVFVVSEDLILGTSTELDNYDLIVKQGVSLTLSGDHNFASIVNYGLLRVVDQVIDDSIQLNFLNIQANSFVNLGQIDADDFFDAKGTGSISITVLGEFINTGKLSFDETGPVQGKNAGNITIAAKSIVLSPKSISAVSLNGNNGRLRIFYQQYLGTPLEEFMPFFDEIENGRVVN